MHLTMLIAHPYPPPRLVWIPSARPPEFLQFARLPELFDSFARLPEFFDSSARPPEFFFDKRIVFGQVLLALK